MHFTLLYFGSKHCLSVRVWDSVGQIVIISQLFAQFERSRREDRRAVRCCEMTLHCRNISC